MTLPYYYVPPYFFPALQPPRRQTYKKVMWTEREDEQLRQAINQVGFKNWSVVADMVPGRTGKQCRERWFGMLNPELAKEDWTPEEDQLLIRLHGEYGNSWAKIAEFMPRRSRISLRNRWGWHVRHQFGATKKMKRKAKVEEVQSQPVMNWNPADLFDVDAGECDADMWKAVDETITWA